MTDTLSPRPRRPLRTAILLLAGTIVAGLVAVVVHEVQAVRRHMAAVEQLSASDRKFSRGAPVDCLLPVDAPRKGEPQRSWLQRLAALASDEYEDEWPIPCVVASEDTSDAELPFLLDLPELRGLSVRESHITDEGLQTVSRLRDLRSLNLRGTPVTSDGIDRLTRPVAGWAGGTRAALAELFELDLGLTNVDDACLPGVARLSSLQVLHLDGTRVSDAGLPAIASMSRLRTLDLSRTNVTDAGLPALGGHPALERLDLGGTRIGDAGLAVLAAVPHLADVVLDDTAVSDRGIAAIAGCRRLDLVSLRRTGVTAEGVARLRSALPECRVRK